MNNSFNDLHDCGCTCDGQKNTTFPGPAKLCILSGPELQISCSDFISPFIWRQLCNERFEQICSGPRGSELLAIHAQDLSRKPFHSIQDAGSNPRLAVFIYGCLKYHP